MEVQVVTMPVSELMGIIQNMQHNHRTEVNELLKHHTKQVKELVKNKGPQKPLTSYEAAEYLDTTTKTLRMLTGSGKVAFIKSGRRVLFMKSDLDAYLLEHRIEKMPSGKRAS